MHSHNSDTDRGNITTRFAEVSLLDVTNGHWVEVYNNLKDHKAAELRSQDDLEIWQIKLERERSWMPAEKYRGAMQAITPDKIAAAVNPSHHKNYIDDLQWLDAMCRIPRYRTNPEAVKGAIELQIRKYLDRNGRKDNELQEMLKCLWYMKYMCAYIKNECNPIRGDEVDAILADKI
jgi:hypothetical protein